MNFKKFFFFSSDLSFLFSLLFTSIEREINYVGRGRRLTPLADGWLALYCRSSLTPTGSTARKAVDTMHPAAFSANRV